jgi:hypothetical protein
MATVPLTERWGWLAGAALGAPLTDRNGAPRRAPPQSVLEGAGPGGAGPTVSLRREDEDTQPNVVLWCFNAIHSLTKAPGHDWAVAELSSNLRYGIATIARFNG